MIDLKFDQVSKRYLIRNQDVGDTGGNPLVRKLKGLLTRREEFWAVRNVSFEVERGEALGIIGHNGAGKSTILKMLSSITTPSSGEITINGRLSGLIEVGSGFHPELTGRENIFLSGSILGMRRVEITRKLDDIIAFAGLHQFIDTPVKRYSSGMYVRLGFSIAAHLDPDILLLDEVLAVGDAAFQSKCLDRIDQLRRSGRTIIFISHDLNAVESMCDRVLLMRHGEIVAEGSPLSVIDEYKASAGQASHSAFQGIPCERDWPDIATAPGDGVVRLRRARVCDDAGKTISSIDIRNTVGIEVTYEVLEPGHRLKPGVIVHNSERLNLFLLHEMSKEWRANTRPVGRFVSTVWIPGNFLAEGSLILDVGIASHVPVSTVYLYERDLLSFHVNDTLASDSARGDYTGPMPGLVRPIFPWTHHVETFEPEAVSQGVTE